VKKDSREILELKESLVLWAQEDYLVLWDQKAKEENVE
jgi:hypothetical protein